MSSQKYPSPRQLPRKLYPNPSDPHLNNQQNAYHSGMTRFNSNGIIAAKKIARYRQHEQNDQEQSDRVGSKSDVFNAKSPVSHPIDGIGQQQRSAMEEDSRVSRRLYKKTNINSLITQNQQQVIQLRERLKNIHHFYRIRIEEERQKNLEKNQIFIGVIEDLQRSHNSKIATLQQQLQNLQAQKQDVNYVDERMESIKTNIEDILTQSRELKQSNEYLEKEILKKELLLKEKQQSWGNRKDEIEEMRNVLENFQRMKLKENKRNRELLELIQDNIDK